MDKLSHKQQQQHYFLFKHPFSSLAIMTLCLLLNLLLLPSIVLSKSTPEPPVFYDCEDEGFFPHPKDCRKYFWCLDSGPANLGIVPHAFTCPSGLYFSTKTEACDYPGNVPCANQPKNKTVLTRKRAGKKTTTSTTANPEDDDEIILTTLTPTTTTEAPTTTIPSTTSKPSKGPDRLLKDAGVSGRHRRPTQQTSAPSTNSATSSGDDNLKQLLQLVQSLGGVERIKSLVNEKQELSPSSSPVSSSLSSNKNSVNDHENSGLSPSSSSRHHHRVNSRQQSTPPPVFSPSYETPRRTTTEATTTTETPINALASNQDNNVNNQIAHVRHRRPQVNQSNNNNNALATNLENQALSSPVTVNPFQSYADPSRATSSQFNSQPFVSRTSSSPNHHINNNYEEEHTFNNNEAVANNENSNLNQNNNNNNNFYSFSYNTPGSRVSISSQTGPAPLPDSSSHNNNNNNHHNPSALSDQGLHVTRPAPLTLPVSSPFNDPFFTYNTPGRFETSAPVTTATEATPFSHDLESTSSRKPSHQQNFARETNRIQSPRNEGPSGGYVRVRVNPTSSASSFRFPEGNNNNNLAGNGGRRATRVRIANPSQINPGNLINHQPSSLSSQTLPPLRNTRTQSYNIDHNLDNHRPAGSQPGVLYDEDPSHLRHHNFSPVTDSSPTDVVSTRKPPRRRPPQREHLRNRQEGNPGGALVNLPPPNLSPDSFVGGDRGIPRPFPPRPVNPPRILPIAVPLVNLPRDTRLPAVIDHVNNNHQDHRVSVLASNPNSFSHSSPKEGFTPVSDPNFRPGTVKFNNLGLETTPAVNTQSSPRPHGFSDDLFATDFPFFGDLPSHNNDDEGVRHSFSPSVFSSVGTTAFTTTTTTESPRPPSEPTTIFDQPSSTRRQRGRGRGRQSTAVTPPTNFNTTPPRSLNSGRIRSRVEVTTSKPTSAPPASAPAIDEEGASIPSGPPVEMESGVVKCTRRGVFAHPGSCGQFVVCAPVSRGSLNYRSYMHHCPAEQVFVEEVGRCRPGNKERCEVFTK